VRRADSTQGERRAVRHNASILTSTCEPSRGAPSNTWTNPHWDASARTGQRGTSHPQDHHLSNSRRFSSHAVNRLPSSVGTPPKRLKPSALLQATLAIGKYNGDLVQFRFRQDEVPTNRCLDWFTFFKGNQSVDI
jgi:hypothetical protein